MSLRIDSFRFGVDEFPLDQWDSYFEGAEIGATYRVLVDESSGWLVMSDTPVEVRSSQQAVDEATGKVLIVGLGLNVIVDKVVDKIGVDSVDVIENDKTVLSEIRTKANVIKWNAHRLYKSMIGKYDYIYWDALGDPSEHIYESYLAEGGKLTYWNANYGA